jgi:hypothetical protein
LASGSWLGVGNDSVYVKSKCFDPFPFPALEESPLKHRIRDLGERLDAHRKRQQEQHPGLTLTGIYNVLEKLRAGEPLTAKDKQIHDQGLVTVLKQIHDELDQAVLEAYGWGDLSAKGTHCSGGLRPSLANEEAPSHVSKGIDGHRPPLQDTSSASSHSSAYSEQLLTRLVALNHERAAEEKRGLIRWLRPDYQNPESTAPQPVQTTRQGTDSDSSSSNQKSKIKNHESSINPSSPLPWPDRLPDQVAILRKLLAHIPPHPETLSAHFGRKNKKRTEQIEGILETLEGLGQL